MLKDQTTNDNFAERKFYDVNLFIIVDEGLLDNIRQYNCTYDGGARHRSNFAASIIHRFLSNISHEVGHGKVLHLHSGSCAHQKKNNSVLGYFMCRVVHGYGDEIVWHYISVGHAKWSPDEILGFIRRHL